MPFEALHEALIDSDLIFVSLETWDDIWRRNQFICAELAQRHRQMQILFVEPEVDYSAAIRRRRLAEMRGRGTRGVDGLPNITVTRHGKWLPNKLAYTRQINETSLRHHVRHAAQRLGMLRNGKQPLLWLNPYYADHVVGRMGEAGVIYDITDDWTQFGREGRVRQRVVDQDRRLSEAADAIIVCSEALYESKRQHADKLHLIKNGVDCQHYATVLADSGDLPEAARSWPKPVLGYTGTVHRDRLDIALVEAVAQRMEQGTLVLIGPNHLNEGERKALELTGRVAMTGPVPYVQLPQYMRAFDVCVVPHRVTPFTESLNPIKLWEYLAAGKPIVATPVAGFRDFPQHVRLAGDPVTFLNAVSDALSENGTASQQRQLMAEEHSWASRVDQIEQVIESVLQQRERRSS